MTTDYIRNIWQPITTALYAAGGVYQQWLLVAGGYVFDRVIPLDEALQAKIPDNAGWRHSGAVVTEFKFIAVPCTCRHCKGTGASKYFTGGKCEWCNGIGTINMARLVEVERLEA